LYGTRDRQYAVQTNAKLRTRRARRADRLVFDEPARMAARMAADQ
jgi:hypothetical protein